MGEAPTVYMMLKDFAGPVATIIASIAAATVAFKLGSRQVDISREQARFAKVTSRAAQQKLILDLFDKRWGIVTELREIIGVVLTTGQVTQTANQSFYLASNRASFLFGPEVQKFLKEIQDALQKHGAAQVFANREDDEKRARAADVQFEQFEIIQEFYNRFDLLIAPYMRIHNKDPDQA